MIYKPFRTPDELIALGYVMGGSPDGAWWIEPDESRHHAPTFTAAQEAADRHAHRYAVPPLLPLPTGWHVKIEDGKPAFRLRRKGDRWWRTTCRSTECYPENESLCDTAEDPSDPWNGRVWIIERDAAQITNSNPRVSNDSEQTRKQWTAAEVDAAIAEFENRCEDDRAAKPFDSLAEVQDCVLRFINSHFRNHNKPQAIATIPADPQRDDDIRLMAHVRRTHAEIADLRAKLAATEELLGESQAKLTNLMAALGIIEKPRSGRQTETAS